MIATGDLCQLTGPPIRSGSSGSDFVCAPDAPEIVRNLQTVYNDPSGQPSLDSDGLCKRERRHCRSYFDFK